MKSLFLILGFFIYFNLYPQNFEDIMKNDTIYIFFEKSENQIFHCSFRNKNIISRGYSFKENRVDYLSFYYSEYDVFDNPYKKTLMDVKSFKKKFIKKNMHKIIDISFMIKYGYIETYNALYNGKKKIYIIDKQEFKRNIIITREVFMSPEFYTE